MFSTSKGLFVRRRRVEYEEAQKNCSVTKLHSSSYYGLLQTRAPHCYTFKKSNRIEDRLPRYLQKVAQLLSKRAQAFIFVQMRSIGP